MERRDFLKILGGVVTSALVPKKVLAGNVPRYPLTSTPDPGTGLDKEKATKSRKLAEYVVMKSKSHPGVLYHHREDRGWCEDVQAVMVVDGKRYTIGVVNYKEQTERQRDDLIISFRPNGTYNPDKLTSLNDSGLDGRCDVPGMQEVYEATLDKLLKFYERREL